MATPTLRGIGPRATRQEDLMGVYRSHTARRKPNPLAAAIWIATATLTTIVAVCWAVKHW